MICGVEGLGDYWVWDNMALRGRRLTYSPPGLRVPQWCLQQSSLVFLQRSWKSVPCNPQKAGRSPHSLPLHPRPRPRPRKSPLMEGPQLQFPPVLILSLTCEESAPTVKSIRQHHIRIPRPSLGAIQSFWMHDPSSYIPNQHYTDPDILSSKAVVCWSLTFGLKNSRWRMDRHCLAPLWTQLPHHPNHCCWQWGSQATRLYPSSFLRRRRPVPGPTLTCLPKSKKWPQDQLAKTERSGQNSALFGFTVHNKATNNKPSSQLNFPYLSYTTFSHKCLAPCLKANVVQSTVEFHNGHILVPWRNLIFIHDWDSEALNLGAMTIKLHEPQFQSIKLFLAWNFAMKTRWNRYDR